MFVCLPTGEGKSDSASGHAEATYVLCDAQ